MIELLICTYYIEQFDNAERIRSRNVSDKQAEIGGIFNTCAFNYPALLNSSSLALVSIPQYIFAFLLNNILYPNICEYLINLYLITPLIYQLLPLDLISAQVSTFFTSLDHLTKRPHIPYILSLLIVLNDHLFSQLNCLELFHSLRGETPDFIRVQVEIKDVITLERMNQLIVWHLKQLIV
jgi:hypothetical protein